MARRKRDAADSKDYIPQPAATEAEVLSMGFPNTGDADRDTETFMNDRARDETPPRDREDKDSEEDETEGEEEDEQEELQVGGQRLRVRKDVAAVLRAQELQLSELRALQNRNIQPMPTNQQEEEVDPLADAEKTLFADPRGTLLKYGEHLKKQVRQELTTQYQADRKTDQYFKEFYTEHKDLAPLDETVKGVLRANIQEVAALNPKASRDRLAQLVRMQIDTIVKTVVPDDERREARRTTVEGATRGGTSRQGNKQQAPRQEVVKSLSSVIRDRKMLRANARTATR